jgi:Fe2+ or Zn2+ uptake regulation protein
VKQHRRTRQLAAVYEVVSAAHDHPTAETVHARVRRKLPHVSLGTVYRNLQKLAATQQVRMVQLADRAVRYDGMLEAHDHFLCERCGMVTDLVRRGRTRPDWSALRRAGYEVGGHTLTFYGCCPKCRDANAT